MNETNTYKLKNGELILFKTNMPESELRRLPIFANQHEFYIHFRSKGYQLEIDLIIKH